MLTTVAQLHSKQEKVQFAIHLFTYIDDHFDRIVEWGDMDRFMVSAQTKCHEIFTDPTNFEEDELIDITLALYERIRDHLYGYEEESGSQEGQEGQEGQGEPGRQEGEPMEIE